MELNLITAVSEKGIIGSDGDLPWNLKDEWKFYKTTTMGSLLIMGRKTYDSVGHPLPGRESWVMTRSESLDLPKEVRVFHSKEDVLQACKDIDKPIFINGGAQIYKMFLPEVTKLYYTTVHAQIEGDTKFPEVNWDEWKLISEYHHPQDERNTHSWTQKTYERIK